MNTDLYKLGSTEALMKLGIRLTFDDSEQAKQHYERRKLVGKVTGAAGNVGGAMVGGTAGSAVGLGGTVGGAYLGSELGQRALSAPATLAMDVAHDIPQKAKSQYRSSLARMNVSSGLPSGIANPPRGV